VPGHDPGDYAEQLLVILSDPAGARRMGDAGVVQAVRFSWDATASEVLSVYQELLKEPSST
jgi:D-inositol-3-phosphate glycosyltransferase